MSSAVTLTLAISVNLAFCCQALAQESQSSLRMANQRRLEEDCDALRKKAPLFTGFHLYEENDSLAFWGRGGDDRYTQGLRVGWRLSQIRTACWANKHRKAYVPDVVVTLGQTTYTPRLITVRTPEVNDRGFTDFEFIGLEVSAVTHQWPKMEDDPEQPTRWLGLLQTAEVRIGVLGADGLAHGGQAGLHAFKASRMPKGWHTSQPNRPDIYGAYRFEGLAGYRGTGIWPDGELTLGPAIEVGGVRTSIGLGASGRVGWNLSGRPLRAMAGTRRFISRDAPRRPWIEGGLAAAFESRAVGYTGLVQSTPGSQSFRTKTGVQDLSYGAFVRIESIRLSWNRVHRSPEYSVAGMDDSKDLFGSLALSYEPERSSPSPPEWRPARAALEVGMGPSFGPKTTLPNGSGIAMQLAARFGLDLLNDLLKREWLPKGLNAGFEFGAAAVEGRPLPNEPEQRADITLRQAAVTIGWTTEKWRGSWGVRLGTGIGPGTRARIQEVHHRPLDNGRLDEDEKDTDYATSGGGLMVGAQFFPHIERHVSLGLDVSYHKLRILEPVPDLVKPSFFKVVILARLRVQ